MYDPYQSSGWKLQSRTSVTEDAATSKDECIAMSDVKPLPSRYVSQTTENTGATTKSWSRALTDPLQAVVHLDNVRENHRAVDVVPNPKGEDYSTRLAYIALVVLAFLLAISLAGPSQVKGLPSPVHAKLCPIIVPENFDTSHCPSKTVSSSVTSIMLPISSASFLPARVRSNQLPLLRRVDKDLQPGSTFSLNYKQCAVVGRGRELLGSGKGKDIDNHTVIMRFEDAPVSGFEADVGSRTTLRLQGPGTCGWHENRRERCLAVGPKNTSTCMMKIMESGARPVYSSPQVEMFAAGFWKGTQAARRKFKAMREKDIACNLDGKQCRRRMSNELLGVLLAFNLCSKVNIYGLSEHSREQALYYRGTKRLAQERIDWEEPFMKWIQKRTFSHRVTFVH
ncbi:hypothetical protein CYMTET_15674 [Cymbomonas tetramitiformis]|uniref:beta-galactoside alpha-(2,6)-sialyltransferase n=1 Tax=Cymbomonas tetramitiformis TaxID=36881 RepID=A0AAE0GDL8_9CHLO|nr:hypothetical protein CYMTET_15674 [Cymbomonas tetramitiformis]